MFDTPLVMLLLIHVSSLWVHIRSNTVDYKLTSVLIKLYSAEANNYYDYSVMN